LPARQCRLLRNPRLLRPQEAVEFRRILFADDAATRARQTVDLGFIG
jgi:hypothetical protein